MFTGKQGTRVRNEALAMRDDDPISVPRIIGVVILTGIALAVLGVVVYVAYWIHHWIGCIRDV